MTATEQINQATQGLDQLNTLEALQVMNKQDQKVAWAVQEALEPLSFLIDQVAEQLKQGGRLFYIGAGTSGRLGVLDASECPPTFSTDPAMVQGIIAGGDIALRDPVEGAEDDPEAGRQAIKDKALGPKDILIGLSASGGAPYVLGALEEAKIRGSRTGCITCVPGSKLAQVVEYPVVVETGPEVLTGSTRLMAGTAQKLVLNMITTITMVLLGKTYGNLMVDVKPTNIKLRDRANRLVQRIAKVDAEKSQALLEEAHWEVKSAIVMHIKQCDLCEAQNLLKLAEGKLRDILD